VFGLHHHGLRRLPYAGRLLAENGGVVADPDNAFRLLHDEQELVLVFPEGTKEGRPSALRWWWDRQAPPRSVPPAQRAEGASQKGGALRLPE
jgi:hypothetical protein